MRTLLLADDSITIQRVIALTFADEEFRVVTASDGREAIDRIVSQPPDIVLAGATMPGVNGYDVARFVRNQPALKGVPVLLLMGAFESVDEARFKASGASGILEKPFEPATVINRVKELLGLKKEARPTPATGRLVTSAGVPRDRQNASPPGTASRGRGQEPAPVRSAASSWDELRKESGLEPDARPVEGSGRGSGPDDYLDTLDAAFDSLDQHLAGGTGESRGPRNLPPPMRRVDPVDPRSPGRRPVPAPEPAHADTILDADADWFAADDQAGAERAADPQQLTATKGIQDVELPEVAAPAPPAAPAVPVSVAPSVDVADAFTALLAFEQGEPAEVPAAGEPAATPPPVVVSAPAPELTDAMLDQIASRVADRLNASLFEDHLRDAMARTVRDTVRSVVSETSERLVRDEIARVKAQAERDTQ